MLDGIGKDLRFAFTILLCILLRAQDCQLKKALAKHKEPSEREAALKRRISSLENLVEYYKKAKFSSNTESPDITSGEDEKEVILKEDD